ncbi:MAG: hypothetical protein FJ035_07420 [Chloroflexi bacterium]|nr:hypothetical protein [Chloroflexota bacterium]
MLHPRERLVEEIRDGVMQDLVAVDILVDLLRARLALEQVDVDAVVHDVLVDISVTLYDDVEDLRAAAGAGRGVAIRRGEAV